MVKYTLKILQCSHRKILKVFWVFFIIMNEKLRELNSSNNLNIRLGRTCHHNQALKYLQMGQSTQEWTKYNLWKTTFKKFEGIWFA